MDYNIYNTDNYKLLLLFHYTSAVMRKAREEEVSSIGITARQASILHLIKSLGDQAGPARIAKAIFREHNSVLALIKRMDDSGLIRKVKSPGSVRKIYVVLTPKGEELYQKSLNMKITDTIISHLSPKQVEDLRVILETLRAAAFAVINELRFSIK